jgi:glutathione S-transferase
VKEHRASYYGAAVYGSVLAAALLGAMREQHVGPRELTLSLVASMLVFWLAHAWSELIGERVAAGRLFDETRIRQIARAEWPLVEAAIVPAIAVVRFLVHYADGGDPDFVAQRTKQGYRALDAMERHLDGRGWLVGDGMTLADIALYAYTHVAAEGGFALERYPALRAWLDRVAAEPGHVPIDA